MYVIHRFDPFVMMDEFQWTEITSADDARARVIEAHEYWNGMTAPGGELPEGTRVVLNTDHEPDPSVYFLTFLFPDGSHQTDLFFVIRNDTYPNQDDISEIGGAQCGDCGRVNCTSQYNEQHNLVAPVWRQHPDTVNGLCDECADKRWGKDS